MTCKKCDLIKNRIELSDNGSVFALSDFADLADNATVRKTITRLEAEGILRRIMRGIYERPEYNDRLGEYVEPSPNTVAHAIARNYGWTIVPCGDTALNLLGLSTQVPSVWVYVSDGAYREYAYNQTKIQFKHTTNKEISKLSYCTALTVQALRALGQEHITDTVIMRLQKLFSTDEKQQMMSEAKTVTAWVYAYIKRICKEDKHD